MAEERSFADRLVARTRELGHPLCVGLDPHLERIPPLFRRGGMEPGDPATVRAVTSFLDAVLARIEGRVAAVKPQSAFFEALGWPGIRALAEVVESARRRGLLVLLDAKRGDVGSTAAAYARAYLRRGAPLEADALTVNPYLGNDTLEPFVDEAAAGGKGVFVLVRTSNPGAGDLQDRLIDGAPAFEAVARSLADFAARLRGPETGWSALGAVVGATWPEQAERVRAALPRGLFLVPGYGAQGAGAADAVRGFVPGPRGLEGGVVSSSRGVLFPKEGDTGDASVWEKAFDAALEAAIGELGEAVAR